jgi:hypothetical protein
MVFAPEVNPNSFVFFFQKGDGGDSWSVRDYSFRHRTVGPRYAHEFSFSADEFWEKVVHHVDAPTHPTTDQNFWHRLTLELNRAYLGPHTRSADGHPAPNSVLSQCVRSAADPSLAFPIIDRTKFDQHAKSRKPQDLNRMLFSRASEDWVTWTAFGLLESRAQQMWWPKLVALAKAENPLLALPPGWEQTPLTSLWESILAPTGYERMSRERMRVSGDTAWVTRSHNPKPVEGASEIDVILRNDALVVFAEAKLGSDISTRTTYDPARNQIVRNIDCVLDQALGRVPLFWMLVRDTGPGRSYTQMLNHYRGAPDALVRELPHHDPARVVALAKNLSMVLWKDLVQTVVQVSHSHNDAEAAAIKRELWLRVNAG